jgi:ADP-ribose pyrophosphatase YjhB (NUDIX family)
MVDNLFPVIRNAVRAVIIRDRALLLLHKDGYPKGERYALPGGAQDTGETLESALQRECLEEIGTEVEIIRLAHVADYFKRRDSEPDGHKHLVEFLFLCHVADDYRPRSGHHPDRHQVDVVWAPLDQLDELPLHPASMGRILRQGLPLEGLTYLGLIE